MVFVLENVREPRPETAEATYEQPLNERMRTFLRLEFLYRQTEHHVEHESQTDTREAITGMLEIAAILGRGDVRAEVLKELERQITDLQGFASNPNVDSSRVDALLTELRASRDALNAIGPHYLQTIKDSEFLSAIKHRSAIPGGTCEFDLPLFSHWLRQPYEERRQHLDLWMGTLRPLCDAVQQVMWLVRESATPVDYVATSGMYQHSIARETSCRMLRVRIAGASDLFPEVSGSPQRFTIRFMSWGDIGSRPAQTSDDVPFALTIC